MVKSKSLVLVLATVLTTMLRNGQCEEKCGADMVYSECGSSCPKTCEDVVNIGKGNPQFCITMCKAGCFCKDGYVLNSSQQCIPEEQCPCPANAEYNTCGSACPNTCEDVANMGNPPMCTKQCVQGCFCKSGYALDSSRNCVPEKECPCHENAEYSTCSSACPKTCTDVANGGAGRACILMCMQGCTCQKGFVLNATNQCVPEKECPCLANATFNDCGTSCPLTCENYAKPPRVCNSMCVQGCFCDKGYVKSDESGPCVLESECPKPSTA